MYELSRVRLFSVGPPGARYSDVVLDLCDVGDLVRAPRQEALFDRDGVPVLRRPSPASVLFLENGGGKSVLIKLIFAVMLPKRTQVVGTTNTRVLEKFVRDSDVAHVLLEWQHTETGVRVVTAKVSEWRGHVVSTDTSKLQDAWYSFRPTTKVNLDSLPLTDGDRLVALSGFRDRFRQLHAEEPELQAVWETGKADWTKALVNLGLDPELFRYQRSMNAAEGEAASAFTFKTDDAFVDFLLRAVVDEEDPRGLAEVVEGYAHKLAQRGALLGERDFVSGALDRLTPLAEYEEQANHARGLRRDARAAAERFHTELTLRHAADCERLETESTQLQERQEVEQMADREVGRLGAVVIELRRLVAEMRWQEAEEEKVRLASEVEQARTVATAWRETDTVLTAEAARQKAGSLRRLIGEQEEHARPALDARDATARVLARALMHTATSADADADRLEGGAEELEQQASDAETAYGRARGEAARQRQLAEGIEARITEVRSAVDHQVRAGLLREDADVAEEADRMAAAADAAREAVSAALEEREQLGQAATRARGAAEVARRKADAAKSTAESASDAVKAAEQTESALASEGRLAELLGSETVDLDQDIPALLERLATAGDAAKQEATDRRMVAVADRRALTALGDGGLLPPPDEVTATLEALADDGITAWSGWRYLATMAPSERDRVLEQHPDLVGGVVLNDPAQMERAESVVRRAQLLPRSIVAVGTTAAITTTDRTASDGTSAADGGFLVPPNPAMYDEEKAEAERVTITAHDRDNQARLKTLDTTMGADTHLVDRLQSFQETYPPGTVRRLRDERDQAATAVEAAAAEVSDWETELETAESSEAKHLKRIPQLRGEEEHLRRQASTLAQLADDVAKIRPWTAEAAKARASALQFDEEARAAQSRATRLRGQARAAYRQADDHRRTADRCRQELSELSGGAEADETDLVPTEPLDVLRRAAHDAAEAYRQVEVDGDLRAELNQAEKDEAKARAKVEALTEEIRALATELARTPDAADAASRAAAARRAERDSTELEDQLGEQQQRVGSLRHEYEQLTPQDRSLEPYGKPSSISHGQQLVDRAGDDLEAARTEHEKLKTARSALDKTVEQTKAAVDGFHNVLESLRGLAPEQPDPSLGPLDGDVTRARGRRDDILANLDDAERLLSEAEGKVRGAADELTRHAGDERFDDITSPVKRQMIAVGRDQLPAHAAEWEQALRPRLRTLEDDIAQIERHRTSIVSRLVGMVDRALVTLRSAQRLSRLPDGLGDWSGQDFLRIKFVAVDEAVMADRIGDVIDEAARQSGKASAQAQRDGMSLLLRGVHAAVPKGFHVEMLKPDSALRTERLRVSEIHDVFSGGQELTAAIILYCTMAALRANDRGRARHRHSGVLFLDNPIGRASAGYLLELQLAVAAALGVQLVYTTGLFDAGALSVFPLIIRLRNDADLRAGLKYLSVDSTIRRELATLGQPDDSSRLGATRVYARPASPESAS